MFLGSTTTAAMESALRGLWQRQRTISHNIANEDTPGFTAKRVDFETYLSREIAYQERERMSKRESVSRLSSVGFREYELGGLAGRADGNNVDLDSEYIELARTQLHYDALQQRINGYYNNLKYVISGGR